jgi:hypothetical protein
VITLESARTERRQAFGSATHELASFKVFKKIKETSFSELNLGALNNEHV